MNRRISYRVFPRGPSAISTEDSSSASVNASSPTPTTPTTTTAEPTPATHASPVSPYVPSVLAEKQQQTTASDTKTDAPATPVRTVLDQDDAAQESPRVARKPLSSADIEQIEYLLGGRSWSSESDEVHNFRETMKRLKDEEDRLKPNRSGKIRLPTYIINDPLPDNFPENFLCKLTFRLPQYSLSGIGTTVQMSSFKPCSEFMEEVVSLMKRKYPQTQDVVASSLILKVSDQREVLHGSNRMCDFEFLRLCARSKKTKIDLDVLDISEFGEEEPLYSYKLTDPTSIEHEQLSIEEEANKFRAAATLPVRVTEDPLPADFKDKVMAKLFTSPSNITPQTLLTTTWSTAIQLTTSKNIGQFKLDVIDQVKRRNTDSPVTPADIILHVPETGEYIHGDNYLMSDFEYVRECVKNNKRPELQVVEVIDVIPRSKFHSSIGGRHRLQFISDEQILAEFARTSRTAGISQENPYVSVWDIHTPFRIKIANFVKSTTASTIAAASPTVANVEQFIVKATLYYGSSMITTQLCTRPIPMNPFENGAFIDQRLEFSDLAVSEIPRTARLSIGVFSVTARAEEQIGWMNIQVFDDKGFLRTGKVDRRLHPGAPPNIMGTCCESSIGESRLTIYFDTFVLPVFFPLGSNVKYQAPVPKKELEHIISRDPLYELTDSEKKLLWTHRDYLKNIPKALPKVLQSVDWINHTMVCDIHRLIEEWAPLPPAEALELLNATFSDIKVREYAVGRLDDLSDKEVASFMIQLVEALKHELYHISPLACFLLRRGISCPHLVGHSLFWALKSEMHNRNVNEKFGLMLEEYLTVCGSHREELYQQLVVVNKLEAIAMDIKKIKEKRDRTPALQEMIAKETFPPRFGTPLSSKIEACGIDHTRCKVMSSAKMPLYLQLKNANANAPNIHIIFKAGDDLRQDILTLQILKIMDLMWKKASKELDLRIIPYGCVATGDGVGMIEAVVNSATMANISAEGGSIKGNFDDKALFKWIEKHNPTPEQLENARRTFVYSCAGYFVATYVLGIGDRHNDNIMITQDANLFHIDFGHFLGHKKMIGKVERETTPFVFTSMYAYVLGGTESEYYVQLEDLAGKAFNVLRKNGNILITLFNMMLYTGIPELESVRDVDHLRQKLELDISEAEAADHFKKLMADSLSNVRQRISDAIHVMKHYM